MQGILRLPDLLFSFFTFAALNQVNDVFGPVITVVASRATRNHARMHVIVLLIGPRQWVRHQDPPVWGSVNPLSRYSYSPVWTYSHHSLGTRGRRGPENSEVYNLIRTNSATELCVPIISVSILPPAWTTVIYILSKSIRPVTMIISILLKAGP